MGRIYKRGHNWFGDIYSTEGIRSRVSLRTRDKKVAEQRLREYELAPTHRASHDLATALIFYVDTACADKAASTIKAYKNIARHLVRGLGAPNVNRVDRRAIQGYIAMRIDEGASRHTVHKELVVLRCALAEQGIEGVVPKFAAKYQPRKTYLTKGQFDALIGQLTPSRALWLMVAAYTGARHGEIEAITWAHIDWAAKWVHVPGTKTAGARRRVPLHPALRTWLEAAAVDGSTGPVVESWGNVRRDLAVACDAVGIPRVTPNDLRRTFASWLKQDGADSLVVAHLLGHTSTRMVEQVYGRLSDTTYQDAILSLPENCDAGVPHAFPKLARNGTIGTAKTFSAKGQKANKTAAYAVPGDGIEPPTRGFSGVGGKVLSLREYFEKQKRRRAV